MPLDIPLLCITSARVWIRINFDLHFQRLEHELDQTIHCISFIALFECDYELRITYVIKLKYTLIYSEEKCGSIYFLGYFGPNVFVKG